MIGTEWVLLKVELTAMLLFAVTLPLAAALPDRFCRWFELFWGALLGAACFSLFLQLWFV